MFEQVQTIQLLKMGRFPFRWLERIAHNQI